MAGDTTLDSKPTEQAKAAKKRAGGPRLRRSAAWSQAVAWMTEATKLPEGEKG